jgi:hypothetical protein
MGLEDSINRLFIRMVMMGGKHFTDKELTDPSNDKNLFPESMGSLKKFFEGGVEEFKKDIDTLKKKKEKAED